MRNARQILDIVLAAFGPQILEPGSDADALADSKADYQALAHGWKDLVDSYSKNDEDSSKLILSTTEARRETHRLSWPKLTCGQWLRNAQGVLSSMASNYDMPRLFLGQAAAVAALVAAAIAAARCVNDKAGSFIPVSGILLVYGVMMFASSYVEEEHHFWYWATTAWFAYLGVRGLKRYARPLCQFCQPLTLLRGNASAALQTVSATAMLLATRIVRSWNQTGQKFAGEPDIVKTYLNTNPALLWCLIGATYFWVHLNLISGLSGLPTWLSIPSATALVLAAFTFKVAFTLEDAPELVTGFAKSLLELTFTRDPSLIARARTVFLGLALLTALTIFFILIRRRISLTQSGTTTLLHLLTLLCITQSRPANIPVYPLLLLPYSLLPVLSISPIDISTTVILLQHTAFFALGGSNSIASVDLSSAYNGVGSFDVAAVGVLTFLGNWGGSVVASLGGIVLLLGVADDNTKGGGHKGGEREIDNNDRGVCDRETGHKGVDDKWGVWKGHVAVLTVVVAGGVVGVMAACTVLRTHLFVWTVFSPKYLYCVAWSLGQHLMVDVALGGVVYWLGVWERGG